MSLVVVTGSTGFIGLHLVEELARRGECVRCVVRSASPPHALQRFEDLRVETAAAELHDLPALKGAMEGAKTVYHAAGLVRAFRREDYYEVNERGTELVAQACAAQTSPPRLVVVSSIAAAGPARRGQMRTEADPPQPVSHYGCSKLAGEQAAAKFAPSVPIVVVRPGIVFGPRDTGFVQVIRSLRVFRCHVSPGFFPPALSCIHVADLVELLLRAAEKGSTLPAVENGQPGKGRYFAVAREHPTYIELGRMLRPMLDRPFAPIISVPGPLAYLMGGVNELIGRVRGKPEELCIDKIRDALAGNWKCSGEAARRDLGFTPAKSLTERMQETVDWCLANRSV